MSPAAGDVASKSGSCHQLRGIFASPSLATGGCNSKISSHIRAKLSI